MASSSSNPFDTQLIQVLKKSECDCNKNIDKWNTEISKATAYHNDTRRNLTKITSHQATLDVFTLTVSISIENIEYFLHQVFKSNVLATSLLQLKKCQLRIARILFNLKKIALWDKQNIESNALLDKIKKETDETALLISSIQDFYIENTVEKKKVTPIIKRLLRMT